jgi:hypothetical protein
MECGVFLVPDRAMLKGTRDHGTQVEGLYDSV